MFNFIANTFGYLLNFLYNLLNNYGLAIIIFSILVKVLLLPLTIKQQKTMEKTTKLQAEMKEIQFKYRNDQEKLNSELMRLYKRENMSPFSGCLTSIIQLILILAVFYMVRSPLTYMKKVDMNVIEEYKNKLEVQTNYPEVEIIKEFSEENEELNINMNFCGMDLSSVPSTDLKNYKNLIIPVLYVLSSIISTKMTMNLQKSKEKEKDKKEKEEDMEDMMQNTNMTMSYMMPFMAFSISLVAPLGLALYWLMSNILMILERIFINKLIETGKE